MARIGKADQPKILHAIDVDHRKVTEVAAEYGCTPANIYALVAKLRRGSKPADIPAAAPTPSVVAEVSAPPVMELFPEAPVQAPKRSRRREAVTATPAPAPLPAPAPAPAPSPPAARPAASATVTDLPRRPAAPAGRGVGAALAKPGFGLAMRTADGDESMTPFRSLDDLLSTVKPMLRAVARNQDPVWFSIQPVDLASLDSDAA